MSEKKISRRSLLKVAGVAAGSTLLAACAPQIVTVKETVVVKETAISEVKVKETVIVAGTPQTVEKVVTVAPPAKETVEITWWQAPIWRYGPDNTTVLGAGSDAKGVDFVKRFEEKFPWIKVKMELIPWDQWNQKLTTGFASGEVGNVIYGQANSGNVQSGYLEPLDDYVTPEILGNWLPGLQAGVTYFGRIYALPTATNPHFTTFSATALEKWGTPELMTDVGTDRGKVTFDMIMEAGKKFGDKATRYFWGVPCDHGSILYWMFGSWLEGWGVKSWDDAEERWQAADSPDAVAAFQWCVDAAAAGVMPPGAMLPKWSDIDNLLWTENLGGRLQWAGMQTELETAQAAGQASKDFKLFYAAFPHKEGLGPFATGMAPIVYTIGKTAKPAVREASFQYANFLSGGDDAAQISWLIEGAFPGTKSGVKATEGHPKLSDPNIKWVLNTLMTQYKPEITGGNWQPVTNARSNKIFFTLDVWNYFVQQFQSLMLGQKTAEEMLKEVATKINTALGATV